MRKIISVFLVLALIAGLLSGCGGKTDAGSPQKERLTVVTTIFPVYDWVREILGDESGVELKLLLTQGVDLHSYQPTVEDMVQISACDVFVYVGGESDEWARDALAEAVNKEMIVINLLEALGDAAKTEELAEGMQAEHDRDEHDDDGEHGGRDSHEAEYDEHVWLSLRNAAVFCETIARRLGEADPDRAEAYAANASAYIGRLRALDAQYAAAAENAPIHTVLFGDRFPFRYLVDDYGLEYYAAFSGCSAETEASFETIIFLAGKIDELGLPAVLTIETGDGTVAQRIIDSTKSRSARILQLDSLQSVTLQQAAAGETYLTAMERNLETLRQALSV